MAGPARCQGVALGAEPIDGLLGLADEIDQPGRVAAPDLGSTGNPVGRGEQNARE
jgi:hypothetical protein